MRYCLCSWYPKNPEDGIRLPATKVTHDCVLPTGCQELSPSPLEEL